MARKGSTQRRRGGFETKPRELIAFCMVGALLLSSGQAVARQLREENQDMSVEDSHQTIEPSISGTRASCNFAAAGGAGALAAANASSSLTLSKEHLKATLNCSGDGKNQISTIPKDLGTKVCDPSKPGNESDGCTIQKSKLSGEAVELRSLLGANRSIQWTQADKVSRDEVSNTEWSLELLESDLPLTQKTFFVGCQKTTSARSASVKLASTCTVTVNVEARASAAEGNVVTCAYGKDSNTTLLEVDMTTENNTLTMDCGSEGTLSPETTSAQYCDPQSTDLKNCTKKFVDILPKFVTDWWTKATSGNASTLTIPTTDFPESEQQFRLGCVPNAASQSDRKDGRVNQQPQASAPTSCSVLVTVKASSSASYASPGLQVLIAVSGGAAVTGLVGASL
ncbi:SAG-related sequence SRS16A [Toxoplasma gondii TgCatPRC2]|uniref:SAG-related sequence SRS16A n=4 Tax=Toxoplasma gondii TaxID=5811 RepID=S7UK17_TOXGG|nr:SAG-related sequence SRS16A [Toxoplasma gondii ME49]EPR58095.1 SAG-related sequence SRS16A [Toxoplasma gondii GT1]EPT31568.1 SAG-related sequence SRS16A [Toxoplasma gondii ME49]KAF4644877.1 SAG-related sequence SRS16A [Toxoplasma gondii]KYK66789.1 SAG-related sequence SRS16A [Toxoplasma gondii TgCatPRC2]|eukprot:XP_002369887.1 SAG-related sequence SRS16A [Toxoplasma gondii ME49]